MPDPLRPGDPGEIGPYRLIGFLGEGGQGAVFLGEGPDGRQVAVKVLHARLSSDEKAMRRFLREVNAARQVAQFCTARVLDAAVTGHSPYVVSEYIEGESLKQLVVRLGPRDAGALERLAVGTATALSAIHQAGIVHRDFKPSNVLMGSDGPRVIDFGIARPLDAVATQASDLVGTPAYMSPEHIAGHVVGPPSDMFSWGITMVYAATGKPAFGSDSVPTVMHRIINQDPEISGLPEPLGGLVTAALSKRPEDRPTATDLLLTLLGHQTPASQAGPAVRRPENTTLPFRRPADVPLAAIAPAVHADEQDTVTTPVPRPHGPGQDDQAAEVTPVTRPPGTFPTEVAPLSPPPAQATPSTPPPARATPPPVQATPSAPPPGVSPWDPPVRDGRRRWNLLAVAAGAVTLIAATAAVLAFVNPFGGSAAGSGSGTARSSFGTPVGTPLTGHTATLSSVAYGQVDGRPVALSASKDGTVRVWDLVGHRQLGAPLTGNTSEVLSVAYGVVQGRPVAISGGKDKTVRVWDLTSGKAIGRPFTGHTAEVWSVAFGQVNGRAVAISGSGDQTIREWDLVSGKQLGRPLTGHTGWVTSVAYGQVNGRAVAISGSGDQTVRVWDLADHDQLGAPLTGHGAWVASVAFGQIDGRPIAISGGKDKAVRVWDLSRHTQLGGPYTGHTDEVVEVAYGQVHGRPIALSSSPDKSVRIWDLTSGKELGRPITGHTAEVWSVAYGQAGGRPLAISGSRDNTLRLWSLETP
ncbi:protein kinase domain-containing protein [Actinomadura scrupuli]|uniref:protein kinase domain-containing protein n=1 Tax=Actinomadura scrupuli TaxID=559629 RepID=UPI003D96C1AA